MVAVPAAPLPPVVAAAAAAAAATASITAATAAAAASSRAQVHSDWCGILQFKRRDGRVAEYSRTCLLYTSPSPRDRG